MSKLRIAVINWWDEPDKKANNWFVEYMKANFDNIECVNPGDSRTDILFASVFGKRERVESCPARVKVLFSGESWENKNYSEYKSEYIEKHYDLIWVDKAVFITPKTTKLLKQTTPPSFRGCFIL